MKRTLSLLLSAVLVLPLCLGGVLAAQVPPEASGFCSQEEWDVLTQVNRERLAAGLEPYSLFSRLQSVADVRAEELAEFYSHTRPNGSECFTALTEMGLGYTAAGENIATGQASAGSVVATWMASQDHRENILDPGFTHMGVGYEGAGRYGTSWVQMFLYKGCSVSGITLSQDTALCTTGSGLDSLGIYIQASCPFHGPCYLPLLSGMCRGFDPGAGGWQTVTVTYGARTAQLQVRITADPSSADAWAVNWIDQADSLELLSLMNQSDFAANVTRLQFADLAVRLAESLTGRSIRPAAEDSFFDTADESVRKAYAAGIASGYPDGAFHGAYPITRQELCVMLSNAINYVAAFWEEEPGLAPSGGSTFESFPDSAEVDAWAVDAVALLTDSGVMSGRGGWIKPLEPTTLQEAVTLAVKLHGALSAEE